MFSTLTWPIILTCLVEASAEGVVPTRQANQSICGPRCVQFVLGHYGQHVELIDLVRELQGAGADRPATMREMKEALRRRGIYAAGVSIRPSDLRCLDWPDPVIVHFNGANLATGHFCVVSPAASSWRALRIWDGLAGESTRAVGAVEAEASGALLLTSRSTIAESPRCVNRIGWFPLLGSAAALGLAILIACRAAARGTAFRRFVFSFLHFT